MLRIALRLARDGNWSVGIGIGAVRHPLPAETREASGPAFNSARDAVTDAKKRPTRFAVRADKAGESPEAWPNSRDAQNVIDLLLEVRKKRSAQGWELHDTLEQANTQAEAARILGITPAAASDRASAAALKIERQALPTIVRLLENLDRVAGGTESKEQRMTTWLAILYWVVLFGFTGASLTLAILAWSAKSHWLIGCSAAALLAAVIVAALPGPASTPALTVLLSLAAAGLGRHRRRPGGHHEPATGDQRQRAQRRTRRHPGGV